MKVHFENGFGFGNCIFGKMPFTKHTQIVERITCQQCLRISISALARKFNFIPQTFWFQQSFITAGIIDGYRRDVYEVLVKYHTRLEALNGKQKDTP